MEHWKTLARKTVLSFNRYLTVESHDVQLPDGRVIPDWPWVILPDFVDVLPVLEDGRVLCLRQFKYGVGEVSLATMGGMIDPGESPEQAARRELYEEMGCEAREMILLGKYIMDANRHVGMAHLYLALGAKRVVEPASGDLEEQEIVTMEQPELRRMFLGGEFKTLSWAATIGLALSYLDGVSNQRSD
jgi:ADP-ribose pyrophosphatase